MTLQEVMTALEQFGNEQTKKTWTNHGASGDFWGVKIGDMKTIQKKIKHDHQLALDLYNTGNADAMYFAGLISEPKKMSREEIQHWAETAGWYMLSEFTVAWVASESRFGHELAIAWIASDKEHIAASGWSTYSCLLALQPDEALDKKEIRKLLGTIAKTIHRQPNRVRYTMNVFVISVGSYLADMTDEARKTAQQVGKVSVDMGGTACKVPEAVGYIDKIEQMGRIGQKRKTVFC